MKKLLEKIGWIQNGSVDYNEVGIDVAVVIVAFIAWYFHDKF
jgi:hypothetical protein